MSKMIKVVVKRTGENHDFCELENNLEMMQEIVGGYLEAVRLPNDIVLWCNEEGLIWGLPQNIVLMGGNKVTPIHGDVLFTSVDIKGKTIGLDDKQIVWLNNNIKIIGKAVHDNKEYFVFGLECGE
jgi:hypothetical protein